MWKHCLYWASCVKRKKFWHFWDSKTFYGVYCFKILRKILKMHSIGCHVNSEQCFNQILKAYIHIFQFQVKILNPCCSLQNLSAIKDGRLTSNNISSLKSSTVSSWSVIVIKATIIWPWSDHELFVVIHGQMMVLMWPSCDHEKTWKISWSFHGKSWSPSLFHGQESSWSNTLVTWLSTMVDHCQPWSTMTSWSSFSRGKMTVNIYS